MKVRELIEALAALNPDADVFLSIDAEGNDFKPIHEAAAMSDMLMETDPTHPWVVETWHVEGDPLDPDEMAVVIWPVN